MATVLFTGFPGFLGTALLPRRLARSPEERAVCVVQPAYAKLAAARVRELTAASPDLAGRIRLVEGDITRPGLGADLASALADITEIWHLAAVYDLEVPREVGVAVNVMGTRHVLDLAERAPALRRLHHVSTCYVSGRYPGPFRETDLDRGQRFNNHYEETKFLAEVEVASRMRGGLPATVYRPAVVVGDSRTGETQKFDGPYYVLRLLLRQPRTALLPIIGDPTLVRFNVVPRDFVVAAITHLSAADGSLGATYQLADPEPLTVDDTARLLAEATRRRVVRLPLPRRLAKGALRWVPGAARLTGIPAAAIDYFVHPAHYLTDRAEADLAGSGIAVPPLRSYVDRLVAFLREHPEITARGMS